MNTATPGSTYPPAQALPFADFTALQAFLQSVGCGFPAESLAEVAVGPSLVRVKLGGSQPNESITAEYAFAVAPQPEPEPEPELLPGDYELLDAIDGEDAA